MSFSLTGSLVALVTPMTETGELDIPAYEKLIDWHVEQGTNALVVVGTSGESPTVDVDEHLQLIDTAVKRAAGRIPVIAGTGANSTAEAVELTREAERLGAQASLQVVPYYNKPTQEGLYHHFRAIAESCGLPIILYNVPGRTVADLNEETTVRLAQISNIVGIKDATSNIERAQWLIRELPDDFCVYSGDDATAVALMLLGGKGNVSVTANVMPKAMAELCKLAIEGRVPEAAALNRWLLPLHRLLFSEPNPVPVKWALWRMGLIGPGIRLPLVGLSEARQKELDAVLVSLGVCT
jgi:4-hydroxy-tetrahydrodipicolinate synthase